MSMSIEERVFNILEATQTNWRAKKLPLVSSPDMLPTGSYGMFRSDNNSWLGSVKDRYVPMQNADLVTFLLQATDMLELEVKRGGSLDGGRRVYYQIELPSEYIGKSDVKRWVTGLNHHDGSRSIAFGSSSTVVICKNSFHRAYRELQKVRHTGNSYTIVKQLALDLRERIEADNGLMTTFKRMADIPMRDEMVERVINKLFKVQESDRLSELHGKRRNNIESFADSLTTEIQLEGKTVWGLFNAVTRYTNHHAAPKQDDKKESYLMVGRGAVLSNLAYEELMQFVDQNIREYVTVGL